MQRINRFPNAVARRYGDKTIIQDHFDIAIARRYGKNYNKAVEKYWKEAAETEVTGLLFFYFSAYLTGIGALLERLGAFCSCPAAEVALKVVYSILLVFYALVPVAGCAFTLGLECRKATTHRTIQQNTPSGWRNNPREMKVHCSQSLRRSRRSTLGAFDESRLCT